MIKEDIIRMALEALESGDGWRQSEAIAALRTAIEQAEKQEPVAWHTVHKAVVTTIEKCKAASGMHRAIDLVVNAAQITHDTLGTDTAPPAAPVQDDIPKIGCVNHDCDRCRALEQQDHSEQNLNMVEQPAPATEAHEQEPVAYDKTELNCFAQDLYDKKMREGKHGHYESMFHVIHQCVKKAASPLAQRKPLTDEQIAEIAAQGHQRWIEFARAIEAAHGITGETQ